MKQIDSDFDGNVVGLIAVNVYFTPSLPTEQLNYPKECRRVGC